MLVPGVMDRWWEDASNYQLEITIPAWLVVIIPLGELFFFSSALTVLEDNFSKSGSPALIALMMNEDRHISGSRCRRHLATPPPPRFMSARCVRVRTYIAHTLPQGHCRYDEDHSTKKQMKVYKFSKYVFFFLILECKLLISISVLCEDTSWVSVDAVA